MQNSKVSKSGDAAADYKMHRPVYKIQPNDILFIGISTEDERISRLFSPIPLNMGTGAMSAAGNSIFYYNGYTVNDSGEISLPYVGHLTVAGLSLMEIRKNLETELSKYLKVYQLFLNLSEFRFTVLGEVNHAGKYNVLQSQLTILEAIGYAGDFRDMANKQKIKLIRQYPDGIRVHEIDITQSSIFDSDLYFLKPNDVIYVEPMRSRTIGNITSGQNSLSLILPIISTALVVFNTYIILKTYTK